MLRASRIAASAGLLVIAASDACTVARAPEKPSTYDASIGALVVARCVSCHGARAPAAGWRATTYLDVIGCAADGRPAALPASEEAPLARVLTDGTHGALLSAEERASLVAWVRAESPKFSSTVHASSFVDPRSPQSHGRVLREKHWGAMLDPNDAGACGRCHDGAPTRPLGVTTGAPGAPACTTCHREPAGTLGCSTCHGQGATGGVIRGYPPRDPCFFPGDAVVSGAHSAHVEGSATHATGLSCTTCHPAPGTPTIGGSHGNGAIDVRLDEAIAGAGATFDATTKRCTTGCHARPGGARPRPAWTETAPMTCGDCHGAPPPAHLAGACTSCHRETNGAGTAFLSPPVLHVNGRVDLGDGSGKCGSCHGTGDDPLPSTDAHPAHAKPGAAAAAPCASCHIVPGSFGAGTGHPRGGPAAVVLSGLAAARGTPAVYAAGSCSAVYCHGAGLEGTTPATPVWKSTAGAPCGSCHALPPAAPHPASTACELCHHDAVATAAGPRIAPRWTALHVNGVVDRGGL